MDVLFEILETIFVVFWVLFFLFGTKIFKIFNIFKKKEKQQPQAAEENRQSQPRELSEEERKLKEWVDQMFGGGPNEQQSETQYYEEDETEYENEYEDEDEEVWQEELPAYSMETATARLQPFESATTAKSVTPQKNNYGRKYGINKKQMAHAFVMSEIFQKPRALRPFYNSAKKKTSL